MEDIYLRKTRLLDYGAPQIQQLIRQRKWMELDPFHRIGAIYDYVQNEILLGYNRSDVLTAAEVLTDGYGQCNTKAILLMTLLRGVGIPCRLHGTEVSKHFQRELMMAITSALAPETVVHTWVEAYYQGGWVALEGVIADKKYLDAVKQRHPGAKGGFAGYAIAVPHFEKLNVDWQGTDTYVQREAVVKDFGVFDSPDSFFSEHPQKWGRLVDLAYVHLGRKLMNRKVDSIRRRG